MIEMSQKDSADIGLSAKDETGCFFVYGIHFREAREQLGAFVTCTTAL